MLVLIGKVSLSTRLGVNSVFQLTSIRSVEEMKPKERHCKCAGGIVNFRIILSGDCSSGQKIIVSY